MLHNSALSTNNDVKQSNYHCRRQRRGTVMLGLHARFSHSYFPPKLIHAAARFAWYQRRSRRLLMSRCAVWLVAGCKALRHPLCTEQLHWMAHGDVTRVGRRNHILVDEETLLLLRLLDFLSFLPRCL